jgi:hypothetical protein
MNTIKYTILAFILLCGIICGIGWWSALHSRELRAARNVAHAYSAQNNLDSNLTCVGIGLSWTNRGNFRLSDFLFLPGNRNSSCLIRVRYTDKCPTNTFEVATIKNTINQSESDDLIINGPKLMSPP